MVKRERDVIVVAIVMVFGEVSGPATVRVVITGAAVETSVRAGAVVVVINVTVAAGSAEAEAVAVTVTPPRFCVTVSTAAQEGVAVVVRMDGETIVAVLVAVRNMKEVFHFVAYTVEMIVTCAGWVGASKLKLVLVLDIEGLGITIRVGVDVGTMTGVGAGVGVVLLVVLVLGTITGGEVSFWPAQTLGPTRA